ncbi:MAG: hypothetical protein ACRD2F_09200 [Terriglobales bacterium]
MPNARKVATAATTPLVAPAAGAPTEGASAIPPQPIPRSPTPPRKGNDVDGFEYLASLSPGEWDDRIVYLYRQDEDRQK